MRLILGLDDTLHRIFDALDGEKLVGEEWVAMTSQEISVVLAWRVTAEVRDGVTVYAQMSPAQLSAREAEEAAAAARATADAAEAVRLAGVDAAINADSTIAQLKAMTAEEFDTWWAANVTNLAQANNVLKRLARLALRRL